MCCSSWGLNHNGFFKNQDYQNVQPTLFLRSSGPPGASQPLCCEEAQLWGPSSETESGSQTCKSWFSGNQEVLRDRFCSLLSCFCARKNEGMKPKQKAYPGVDVTGDRSKVRCCKEQGHASWSRHPIKGQCSGDHVAHLDTEVELGRRGSGIRLSGSGFPSSTWRPTWSLT